MRHIACGVTIVALMALRAMTAHAQPVRSRMPAAPPPYLSSSEATPTAPSIQTARPVERDGFLVGFGLGFGSALPCDDCAGMGGSFSFGAMSRPNLALMWEFVGVGNDDGDAALSTISLQYWPRERWWIKGGLGLGTGSDDDDEDDGFSGVDDDEEDTRFGATIAVGYEFVQRGRFALDLHLRGTALTGGEKNTSVLFGMGFFWY